MTRFEPPEEPGRPRFIGPPGDAPLDLGTVLSDPAVFSAPTPRALLRATRCGHGRF